MFFPGPPHKSRRGPGSRPRIQYSRRAYLVPLRRLAPLLSSPHRGPLPRQHLVFPTVVCPFRLFPVAQELRYFTPEDHRLADLQAARHPSSNDVELDEHLLFQTHRSSARSRSIRFPAASYWSVPCTESIRLSSRTARRREGAMTSPPASS